MRRREFLAGLARLAAGGGVMGPMVALEGASPRRRAKKRAAKPAGNPRLRRVGISSWSFHNDFPATRDKDYTPTGPDLVLLDFPGMIAQRYGVHNLEMVAPHFASTEPAYLQVVKTKLQAARSRLINIPVDIPEIWHKGGLSDPDPNVRQTAIQASSKWIDIAKQLGALSVRCDPGGMNVDDLTLTIESYRILAAYGKSKGIDVLIENHGPIGSTHPGALLKLFQAVGSNFLGALPDFGNFPDEETRQRGLPMLFPYAKTVCHAKGLEFDANGNETKFNFAGCIEVSKRANYKGVYSIEFEGSGDPYTGVKNVVNELVRYL